MLRCFALLALVPVLACSREPSPASAPTAAKAEPTAKPEPTTKTEPPADPKLVPPPAMDPTAEPPPPEPAQDEPKPEPAEVDSAEGTGNMVTLTEGTKTSPAVTVGDTVVVELAASSQGIAPEYRFRWGDAAVTGDAVVFVKLETRRPPPDVDGGHDTLHYIFRAERPGTSTITVPVASQGPEAFASDFSRKVTVKAR